MTGAVVPTLAFAEVFRSRSFLFLGSGLAEYLLELFGEVPLR